jgi:acyl-CoA thioester hydrolase
VSAAGLPSFEQVLELPVLLEREVPAEFIDINGHMNIGHYLQAGAASADVLCRQIGIDDDYRADRRLGVFTAEHHIQYFSEMRERTAFSAHTVLVDRSAKAAHMLSFILDRTNQRLSCLLEIMLINVDMDSRRPTEFPPDVAVAMDDAVAVTSYLDWPLPLSGSMAIRKS